MVSPNAEHVKHLLQDVELNVYTDRTNSQDNLPSEELVVSAEILLDMLVVVRPGKAAFANEKFWLARVVEVLDSGNYKLCYFKFNGKKKQ